MEEFLDSLSAGDIPKSRIRGGGPIWDFQLDYGEFAPDFKDNIQI